MLSALADTGRPHRRAELGQRRLSAEALRAARTVAAHPQSAAARGRAPTSRRAKSGSAPVTFNLPRGELRREGELVRLTTREKDLLRLLAAAGRQSGAPRGIWPSRAREESARSVDVQINRLRQKIENDPANPGLSADGAGRRLYAHLDRLEVTAMPATQPTAIYRRLQPLSRAPSAGWPLSALADHRHRAHRAAADDHGRHHPRPALGQCHQGAGPLAGARDRRSSSTSTTGPTRRQRRLQRSRHVANKRLKLDLDIMQRRRACRRR